MKKIGIMHSEISAVIASLGHNDTLTIVDAGYPIPTSTKRIDLALEPGVPGFLQTLRVVLQELFVERIILAEEIQQFSRAVIRTAEFTPYSNIILVAGPWGFKL